ncbi:hypothetical protein [Corynebacterium epidermidicanis]|uniref:Sulfite reductase, beta subunit (Hemoprotein) n=1 Tax=Corynebacterium epidermidicanis TaxID=1050174 RepID=A0A0G3GRE0_9CORY|nr:hypothetical protein [Corynebacterium epidermidicanis]AKK03120.1 sulfite reductase, beta subunit (hemoprotein) [Corynebacterium epidermidicanis]
MTSPKHASAEKVACDLGLGDRSRVDGCPGALSFHHAADGAIGRVRFPGGLLSPADLESFVAIASQFGDGDIHLTTRGNVQVRAITDTDGFSFAVQDAGLVPSVAHDKVRNIIASPLAELEEHVAKLDRALLSSPALAGLSGRTLFGLDGGDGAILAQQPDFGALFDETGTHIILGGRIIGQVNRDPIATIATLAHTWQEHRGDAWRVAEKPELHQELIRAVSVTPSNNAFTTSEPTHIGWFDREDGSVSLGAGLIFGILPAKVNELLVAVGKPVQVTPWHSVLIHDLDEGEAEAVAKVLAPMGLIFDAHSPKLQVTACTGLPGCAKSRSDVRRDALQLMVQGNQSRAHFSGCERRCGHPRVAYTDYLALSDSEYEVTTR